MSEILNFVQGDAKWHAYRKKFLSDLFWANNVVLGFGAFFPMHPETHLLLNRFLERKTGIKEIDEAPIQKIEAPRGSGKSLCGTVGHAVQIACGNPDVAILIANEKEETAIGFLAAIKHQFEQNEFLRALFPEVIPPDFNKTQWSAQKATLKRTTGRPEPTFQVIGVGGTVTGIHPDIVLVDDPISREAMENARAGSWQIMEKANRWTHQLKPLLNTQYKPFPWIRFIGTRWWTDDTHQHVEEVFGHGEEPQRYLLKAVLPEGGRVSREIYRVGEVAVFRMAAVENGKLAFPDLFSWDFLANLRAEDPELYACNYLNDPSDAAVTTFRDDWLRYWSMVDRDMACYDGDNGQKRYVRFQDLHKILLVDPAFTTNPESARSALVVVGSDMEGHKHLVLEATALQAEPADLVTEIINTMSRWGVFRVFVESVAQQKGLMAFLQAEAQKRNLPLALEELKPGGRQKDIRIEALGPYIKGGAILFHNLQLDLLDEYRRFRPGARFKDLLDALAYGPETWPRFATTTGNARQRSQQQLQGYLSRRGLSRV